VKGNNAYCTAATIFVFSFKTSPDVVAEGTRCALWATTPMIKAPIQGVSTDLLGYIVVANINDFLLIL